MPPLSSPSGSLKLTDVHFSYGHKEVLPGISTEFIPGVSGLLGTNGAGKTTALRLAAGLTRPGSGTVSFGGSAIDSGRDRSGHRARVGYLPQNPRWYAESTVSELITYIATSRMGRGPHVRRAVEQAMDAADVSELRGIALGKLSGGQLRRAFLAQAVVHDPPILILDEPTAGLDPVQRIRLREKVVELSHTRVVVWATHIIDDLMSMADQIVILDNGLQQWCGSPDALAAIGAKQHSGGNFDVVSDGERGFLRILSGESS